MCGRINVSDHEGIAALLAMMGMPIQSLSPARYNVAPGSSLDVVANSSDPPTRQLQPMHWGFSLQAVQSGSRTLFNARAETVFNKPTFAESARLRRAIVVINGFYEWQVDEFNNRLAHHILSANRPALALAAIYQPTPAASLASSKQHTQSRNAQMSFDLTPEREDLDDSCAPSDIGQHTPATQQVCILTQAANEQMRSIHHRMPVPLDLEQAHQWLEAGSIDLLQRLQRQNERFFTIKRVGAYVNKASNDGAQCIATDPQNTR